MIECKIVRGTRETTIETGLNQVTRYADTCGADEVYLILFDRSEKTWEEKIFSEIREKWGMEVRILGMESRMKGIIQFIQPCQVQINGAIIPDTRPFTSLPRHGLIQLPQ